MRIRKEGKNENDRWTKTERGDKHEENDRDRGKEKERVREQCCEKKQTWLEPH